MSNQFAFGKHAIAECDICSFRYKLHQLKKIVIKGSVTNIKACPTCWDKDHPQLMLGTFPVNDPQAVREPRPDNSYYGPYSSRDIQWGWSPVGGPRDSGLTPSSLVVQGYVGDVTVTVS